MEVDEEINVTGTVCPMPLVTLHKELRKIKKNKLVRITGDDPLFEEGILDFCQENGHEILENKRDGRQVSIVFRT
jgi:tRNA 2-thiouridine synthesizing protein A